MPHGSTRRHDRRASRRRSSASRRAFAIASWRATRIDPADFERYNANFVGGAITGGVADLTQLFTRPVARLDPYSTPNPRLFLCSASTPPGGGVHGMCGYFAAQSALRQLSSRDSGSITARSRLASSAGASSQKSVSNA